MKECVKVFIIDNRSLKIEIVKGRGKRAMNPVIAARTLHEDYRGAPGFTLHDIAFEIKISERQIYRDFKKGDAPCYRKVRYYNWFVKQVTQGNENKKVHIIPCLEGLKV